MSGAVAARHVLAGDLRATTGGVPGVTLRAIRPGVVDDYGSLWRADAFDRSLRDWLPVLCWGHDARDIVGVAVSFTPSSSGPLVQCRFDDFDAVPRARQAYAQVKSGTIRNCSVGFSQVKRREPTADEVRRFPGVREVIERARLDEISLVYRGAVPGADVVGVRQRRRPGSPLAEVLDGEALEVAEKWAYRAARRRTTGVDVTGRRRRVAEQRAAEAAADRALDEVFRGRRG